MEKGWLIFAFMIVLSLGFASATITLNEPNNVYSLGDKLYISLTVNPSSVSGNFEINLICQNSTINLYRVPAESSFSIGNNQKISTFVTLTPQLMRGNLGSCYISSFIGSDNAVSKTFTITNLVDLNVILDKQSYNPGEKLSYSLNATKANGQVLDGFLEVSDFQSFSRAVQKGIQIDSFMIPSNTSAGSYSLNFNVYDRGENNSIANQGIKAVNILVNQVPTSIQISTSGDVVPGENLSVKSDLYDQSGNKMPGVIQIDLISPNNDKESFSVNSGDIKEIDFNTNATAGIWKVSSYIGNVSSQKEFDVQTLQKVSYDLQGNKLIVKNIGNVLYNQSINVSIGDIPQSVSLSLVVGEVRTFYLRAPDGEYNVSVGEVEKSLMLTGDAISISEATGWISQNPIIGYIILAIIALGVLFFIMRNGKKQIVYNEPKPVKTIKMDNIAKKELDEVRTRAVAFNVPVKTAQKPVLTAKRGEFVDFRKASVSEAESSLVLKGQKTSSTVVCIKINSGLTNASKQEIEKILSIAKEKKGVVDWREKHILIVFSPLVTKTYDNEPIAARVGFDIFNELKEYNRKANDKIDFGIGMNTGDLIAAIESGKLKYTSMGNTILLAKKIADIAAGRILVSDLMRNKIARDIRGEKVTEISGIGIYSIVSLQDREANKAKLDDLLKRIGR